MAQSSGFTFSVSGNPTDFSDMFVCADCFNSGGLWSWGNGTAGILGNGSTISTSSPVQVIGANWKQIVAGSCNAMALKTDGTMWLWGCNLNGQLGTGTTINASSPVQTVATGSTWQSIATKGTVSSAIDNSSRLWTWGSNVGGQLGLGTTINTSSPVQTIAGGNTWKTLGSGPTGALASIQTNNSLWLWGCNNCGQLGTGTTIDASSPVQTVGAATTWKQVSTSQNNSAAVKTDGTLWVWGDNSKTQLGTGYLNTSATLTFATNNWQQISNSGLLCARFAIKCDGTLWAWGSNCFGVTCVTGNLGDGTVINRSSPVLVLGSSSTWRPTNVVWTQIAGGAWMTGGIKSDGTLWTWGYNNLGHGTTVSKSSPVQTVAGGTTWCHINVGYQNFAAIKTDGTLWTWGLNSSGQLGNGLTTNASSPVQTIDTSTTWKQTSFSASPGAGNGAITVAAIKTDGTLWTWGYGRCGPLGDGTTSLKSSPVQTIAGGTTWCQVAGALGRAFAAIKTDGTLWTWGFNNQFQLGTGIGLNYCSPAQVSGGGTTWKQVAGQTYGFSAVKTDGTLWAWGCNNCGQLGDGTTIIKSIPTQIGSETTWVSAGPSMALKTDGSLWTWGFGVCGALGDGTTINKSSPIQTISNVTTWAFAGLSAVNGTTVTISQSSPVQTIACGTNWKQVSVGVCNAAAVKTDGTLWVWGDNTCGALGTGTTLQISSPTQTVGGGNNWKCVSVGLDVMSAIKTDGSLWVWGNGLCGSMMQATNVISYSSPVQTFMGGGSWLTTSVAEGTTAGASILGITSNCW